MIVLDTQAVIWWASGSDRLSPQALRRIEQESDGNDGLLVSSISTWEIAMLVNRSRLSLSISIDNFIQQLERIPAIRFVPVNNSIALESTRLPEPIHRDPADRMIIATARVLGCPVISSDSKLQDYPHVETVW